MTRRGLILSDAQRTVLEMHFNDDGSVRQTFKDIAWSLGKSSVQPQWQGSVSTLGDALLLKWLGVPIPEVTEHDLERYAPMCPEIEKWAGHMELAVRTWIEEARAGTRHYQRATMDRFGVPTEEMADLMATHHDRRMRRIRPWRDDHRPRFVARVA